VRKKANQFLLIKVDLLNFTSNKANIKYITKMDFLMIFLYISTVYVVFLYVTLPEMVPTVSATNHLRINENMTDETFKTSKSSDSICDCHRVNPKKQGMESTINHRERHLRHLQFAIDSFNQNDSIEIPPNGTQS
jgi:hypothetical protein